MQHIKDGCHQCAPRDWRETPDVSGAYELDAAIARNSNRDLPDRLKMYVGRAAYGPRTAYNGYHGYGGDD